MNFASHYGNPSLSRRFILFLFSVLGLVSACFLLMFYYFYNTQLADERRHTSQSVNLLFESSLKRAMLRRDLAGLHNIVHDLGQQQGIQDVLILNPDGEVRFSAQEARLGSSEINIIKQFHPTYPQDHLAEAQSTTLFVKSNSGQELLRAFHPIHNQAECASCHGSPANNPVNGILVIDYDASTIRQKGWTNILMLIIAGVIAVFFSALAAWWFMRRYVLQPVKQLDQASKDLSQGKLTGRVSLQGSDEIANLGKTFNTMAERLQFSQAELQSREQFLQGLIDGIPDGVRVIDRHHRIIAANQAYAKLCGVDTPTKLHQKYCYELTYQRQTPCLTDLHTCPLQALNSKRPTLKFYETLRRNNGDKIATEVYAARLIVTEAELQRESLVVESVRDLQEIVQYSHEQKLASLGELAAGVAHEIHNPLASIRIALQASDQLLEEKVLEAQGQLTTNKHKREIKEYLQLVDEKVEHCLDVTRRLMKLGSLGSSQPELVEVNTAIEETLSLLRFEREMRNIKLQLDLARSNPRILAADNDVRMMILNLSQNAFHAMTSGDTLSIRTWQERGYVMISVTDTGSGIDANILDYVFEPFFSRRKDTPGSGLGLTIVRSLATQHNGSISIVSHLPGKTTFVLSFLDIDAMDTTGQEAA